MISERLLVGKWIIVDSSRSKDCQLGEYCEYTADGIVLIILNDATKINCCRMKMKYRFDSENNMLFHKTYGDYETPYTVELLSKNPDKIKITSKLGTFEVLEKQSHSSGQVLNNPTV
jgi:hypothetical protein